MRYEIWVRYGSGNPKLHLVLSSESAAEKVCFDLNYHGLPDCRAWIKRK